MVLPLITPTWQASPANGGTVTITPTSSGEDPAFPGHSLYQAYTYTAAPAFGYRFVRFEITEVHSSSSTLGPDPDTTASGRYTANPYVAAPSADDPPWDVRGVAWTYDYNGIPGYEQYNMQAWCSSILVTAVFERAYTPTNLLVNTYNRSTPVQLVYDDRAGGTGLLVADY